jgi:hypothetical protein
MLLNRKGGRDFRLPCSQFKIWNFKLVAGAPGLFPQTPIKAAPMRGEYQVPACSASVADRL